jgi:predicted dehydrogenase
VKQTSRRQFLKQTALAGVGFWVAGGVTRADVDAAGKTRSANEKLNLGIVGAGGQGGHNLGVLAGLGENIVALCDVDADRAKEAFAHFPNAKKYKDYRKMLDTEKHLDAVVVSTPDHMHAIIGVTAMRMGKHCYCEKPLTHDVAEARLMRETAHKHKVATQMGNMGTAENGFRHGVEFIQSGVLGPVKEVYVWSNRPIWPQGIDRPAEEPVPETMAWDLWLGTAPTRPYNQAYAPFKWRGWADFGTGALGDMACHTVNLPYMGLKLTAPTTIEARTSGFNGDSYPSWSIINFEFPARDGLPPVKLTWSDGGKKPPEEVLKNLSKALKGKEVPGSGCLIIGEKDTLYSPDDYGARSFLLREAGMERIKGEPQHLPHSPGHHKEWVMACKGGKPGLANFDYGARLTEAILLGNVAMLAGKPIEWDAESMRVKNDGDAQKFIQRHYREGWNL